MTGVRVTAALTGLLALLALVAVAGATYSPYFKVINDNLRGPNGPGRTVPVVDVDVLSENIGIVREAFVPGHAERIRVVTKSLPSLDLLDAVLKGLGSTRLMVFDVQLLKALMDEYSDGMDYLWGMPVTVQAAERFISSMSGRETELGSIQWLVDSLERLHGFVQLAAKLKVRLRINVEIDVGLHRGGAVNASYGVQMLEVIAANPELVTFSGFMGYDGQVAFNPYVATQGLQAIFAALEDVCTTYQSFIDAGKAKFPKLFANASALTFNGAGSNTVALYQNVSKNPLNDYAMGSGFVKPADFDTPLLQMLSPALYVAGVVIKTMGARPPVPYLDDEWEKVRLMNPEWCQSLFVAHTNFATSVDPLLVPDPFYAASGETTVNLRPTQSLMHANCSVQLSIGDNAFFRPLEGDGIGLFKELYVLQGAQHNVSKVWDVFHGGL